MPYKSQHVEFIGPPGVGKSTIHQKISKQSRYYGSLPGEVCARLLTTRKHILLQRLMPDKAWNYIADSFLKYRVGNHFLPEFIQKHPEYVPKVIDICEEIQYESNRVSRQCLWVASCYQIGMESRETGEVLCMHEGFLQKTVAIAWRSDRGLSLAKEYLEDIPLPRAVVYLTAQPTVCLQRQEKRKRTVVAKDWAEEPLATQNKLSNLCSNVVALLEDMEIDVIEINNDGPIKETVNKTITDMDSTI
ncbi:hypothetical protein [Natronococcus amylolyticus]|uniref:hypothetical protein n=1 Tax=Natronococcus amylolyticus TaxID=44470 RepID=UPI001267AE79|nr:hypothetical protein [Natronococcus amylolyticus]